MGKSVSKFCRNCNYCIPFKVYGKYSGFVENQAIDGDNQKKKLKNSLWTPSQQLTQVSFWNTIYIHFTLTVKNY